MAIKRRCYLTDQLREIRRAKGDTLDVAARRSGIPATVIGSYERGDRSPSIYRVSELLAVYGYELTPVPTGAHQFVSWLLEHATMRYGAGSKEWEFVSALAAQVILSGPGK